MCELNTDMDKTNACQNCDRILPLRWEAVSSFFPLPSRISGEPGAMTS